MLALSEKQMLIQALGKVVYDEVQTAILPIQEKIAALELSMDTKCKALLVAVDIKDDLDKNALHIIDHCEKLIDERIKAIPPALPGKDADLEVIAKMIEASEIATREFVAQTIEKLPKPEKGEKGDPGEAGKDGKDGRDGTDGQNVSLDDIRSCLADLVVKAFRDVPVPRGVVGGFIDRGGNLYLSFSDGSHSNLGEVVGRDGKDCDLELVRSQVATFLSTIEKPKDGKDGIDGVGFDDLELSMTDERGVMLKFVKGDIAKVFNLNFPIPIFRDIWKEGAYERGDIVVRDGSMWIAMKDTKAMPGLPDSGWRLCTKRGRDGKEGKQGPEGKAGKDGKNGRDLTQIGSDGSKW